MKVKKKVNQKMGILTGRISFIAPAPWNVQIT